MSWATRDDVLKHYRMLTRTEALIRQLALVVVTAAIVSLAYLWVPLMILFVLILAGNLIHAALDLYFPAANYRRETMDTLFRRRQSPSSNSSAPDEESGATHSGDNTPSEETASATRTEADPQDAPVFARSFDDLRPFIIRALASRQGVQVMKVLSSLVISYPLGRFISSLPFIFAGPLLFTINAASLYLICTATLYWIEAQEIDEFPTDLKDVIMLSFYKKFSYSRGYYFIGEVQGKKIGLSRMARFLHTLIGAPTGEGKSSSLIIPPLLFDAESVGSAVVPDAKSPELFNWVAGRWKEHGKKVFLFDPWHPQTVGINFLPDADDQDLLTVVDVMMREREEAIGKEDAFFKSRTRYLLYAILKLVQSFKPEYCTMTTVYRVIESVEILESFIETASDDIKALFADFHKLYAETKVNALTSIREKCDIFMDKDVRKAFSKSEFTLSMLFQEKNPCLLVLGAPIDRKEQGTKIASLIVNLVINLAFKERRMQKQAIQRGEKSFTPCDLYLYLDELRSLKITALADLVSIARETRTHVIGSVTDIGFFKYYKEDFSSLMGNFRTRLFMRGFDYESGKYVSDSLGKEDVVTYKYMRGVMASQEQRNLLDPDKVMNLPEDKLIVFSPKARPFIADKVSIYKTGWLKKMQVPPPNDLRRLYEEWNVATGDLQDPALPKINGHYDVATMRSGKAVVFTENVTVDRVHREMGGGVYREAPRKEFADVAFDEQKVRRNTDDEDAAASFAGPI